MFTDTWLPTRDGVVSSILTFREELLNRGHGVFLFVPSEKNENDFDERIFYYRSKKFRPYPQYRKASLFDQSRTVRLVKKLGVNILHSHSPGIMGLHAVISSYKLKLPLAFTYHTSLEDSLHYISNNGLIRHLLWIWLKWYFRRCHAIIVPSEATARELFQKVKVHPFIVPTGISQKKFSIPDGNDIRKRIGKNKNIVLHVGRIVKEKNLDLLIEAAKFVDVKFLIVGEGPAKEGLKKKISLEGLDDRFKFAGFVPDEELPKYYRCADAFVFPSTYETQGIVALEAMASGLPVAAANYRALPEIIEDGKNGFLFDPFNAKECAESIIKALDAPASIRENAMKTAEKYSVEKCTNRLLMIYEGLLGYENIKMENIPKTI